MTVQVDRAFAHIVPCPKRVRGSRKVAKVPNPVLDPDNRVPPFCHGRVHLVDRSERPFRDIQNPMISEMSIGREEDRHRMSPQRRSALAFTGFFDGSACVLRPAHAANVVSLSLKSIVVHPELRQVLEKMVS